MEDANNPKPLFRKLVSIDMTLIKQLLPDDCREIRREILDNFILWALGAAYTRPQRRDGYFFDALQETALRVEEHSLHNAEVQAAKGRYSGVRRRQLAAQRNGQPQPEPEQPNTVEHSSTQLNTVEQGLTSMQCNAIQCNSNQCERERSHTPLVSFEKFVSMCHNAGCEDFFIRYLWETWNARGWKDKHGTPYTIEGLPFMIRSWREGEKDIEGKRALFEPKVSRPAEARPVRADDWVLCADRCAHCVKDAGGAFHCRAGVRIPYGIHPEKRNNPPEDCRAFMSNTPAAPQA